MVAGPNGLPGLTALGLAVWTGSKPGGGTARTLPRSTAASIARDLTGTPKFVPRQQNASVWIQMKLKRLSLKEEQPRLVLTKKIEAPKQ